MAFSLFSGSNKIVNLVLNDHSVRYVELKQKNPAIPLHYGQRILPNGIIMDGKIQDIDTLMNILDECIDDWKIAKREIRFTVPDSLVIIRKVSIPADVKEDEIHGYLYLELGTSIHLPFEDPVFDVIPLGVEGKKQEILVFAAPEQYVNEYADLFKSLRLKPIAVDISPLAIYRLYHQLDMHRANEVLLSVQFDLDVVSMCVFEEHIPVFMRHIPGDMKENWSVKVGEGSSQSEQGMVYVGELSELTYQLEEIYRDITKLMDFYRYSLTHGKKEVSRILVNGDHPMLDRVHAEMKELFEIPVDTLKVSMPGVEQESLPNCYNLALGLGLKEV
ncbi:pilus assembly protein PilM [Bacillus sp. ISL-37]|jgi:type IV pilus assembly protein PilM|uniref:type IV pilus biogenesis protein PilM n=1 Tax=Bacillus sp. ISL-37 TaxID=2819123 RepID=UPI001BEC8708|nr:pilus assembly protein PilM [Bacillus sp. ISL-37]MBT2684568.1 pilus assembly protein PilM [Bacillus sp. ISL-37]